MIQDIGNEIARRASKLLIICVAIGACLFMLGLLVGFLLGGDSERMKPVAEWDNPVGIEARQRLMMQETNQLTEDLIEAMKHCYPEGK